MSRRQSRQTTAAVELLRQVGPSLTITQAARQAGIHTVTLRRALRRAGEPPRPVGWPLGLAHDQGRE